VSDSDYLIHKVLKRSSGKVVGIRIIEEPKPELKIIQKVLVKELQLEVDFPSYINGVSKTSIITNSNPHINKPILYKIDLKDFYHTVDINKIARSLLTKTLLDKVNNICMYCHTECDRSSCKQSLPRRLPTGAPTSPILANIAFLSTDIKINKLLNHNINYTRYMDDICLSSIKLEYITPELINNIIQIIELDGYIINRKKSGIHLDFKRQEVTGIVVNKKLNLSKDRRLLLRAKLDHLARSSRVLTPELAGELAHVSNISKQLSSNFMKYFLRRVSYYAIQETK